MRPGLVDQSRPTASRTLALQGVRRALTVTVQRTVRRQHREKPVGAPA